jgi:hypothetical protein
MDVTMRAVKLDMGDRAARSGGVPPILARTAPFSW